MKEYSRATEWFFGSCYGNICLVVMQKRTHTLLVWPTVWQFGELKRTDRQRCTNVCGRSRDLESQASVPNFESAFVSKTFLLPDVENLCKYCSFQLLKQDTRKKLWKHTATRQEIETFHDQISTKLKPCSGRLGACIRHTSTEKMKRILFEFNSCASI